MQYVILIVVLLASMRLTAQHHDVLSAKHLDRLKTLHGKARLTRYLSFFKKDSIRLAHQLEKAETHIRVDTSHAPELFSAFWQEAPDMIPGVGATLSEQPSQPAGITDMVPELSSLKKLLTNRSIDSSVIDNVIKNAGEHLDVMDRLNREKRGISCLLKKYREYANSADLKNATRSTSMAGEPLVERLIIALNLQPSSWDPVSVNISPVLGFRITRKMQIASSVSYHGLATHINPRNWDVSSTGYRLSSSYLVKTSIFTHVELERTRYNPPRELHGFQWSSRLSVGLGKKLLIHSKLYSTITALYCISADTQVEKFSIRFGFEISELNLRTRKPVYHPNQK